MVHAEGAPHCPTALHVWTPLPEHCFCPGAHTPAHAPFTHVWLVHAEGAPHCPLPSQVCTPLPEHWVAFGVHEPAQVPAVHTAGHAAPLCHWPFVSQLWGI